jgi:hypothetical protein
MPYQIVLLHNQNRKNIVDRFIYYYIGHRAYDMVGEFAKLLLHSDEEAFEKTTIESQ